MSEPHPVLALLRERARNGSQPGARGDGQRLALVLEGGGMRGVVSAGMASALERRGLLDCFDLVVGTSAGALNAAAFLAGVVEGCLVAYHAAFATRRFINPYRLLIGRAAIDVAFTLDHVDERLDAARHARTVASRIPLRCIAVDVDTAAAEDLTDLRSEEDLRCALLASSRMPWIGGAPVEFRGRRWLDGGLAEPIAHQVAVRLGATHVLVLMTRPLGASRTPLPRLANRIIERWLRRLNPELVELHRRRTSDYEAAVSEIAAATSEPGPRGPFVYGLRLARSGPEVGQLERRPAVLETAGRLAMERAAAVLDAAGVATTSAAATASRRECSEKDVAELPRR
ncbi:MAG: patatin-like phospholipase family protein [Solirubrobacteraceae bacterium]